MENLNQHDLGITTTVNSDNPFLSKLILRDKTVLKKIADVPRNIKIMDSKSNEIITDHAVYADEVANDVTPFVKLFGEGTSALSQLTTQGFKLWLFICHKKLIFNIDVISFTPNEYAEAMEVSIPTVYRAIDDLINNELIARRKNFTNSYHINPSMFYKGTRKHLLSNAKKT